MKKWDVLGIGALAVDDLLYVDEFPQPDSKTQVRERRREGGGLIGTALVAAARLGASAAWCGVLGEDELAREARRGLENEGVDCSAVLREDGAQPHYSVVIVDNSGARTLLALHGGVVEFPAHVVTCELIGAARVLLLDHHGAETALRAAELARELCVPVVADLERATAGQAQLLPLIDHLVVGMDYGRELTGESEPEKIAAALGQGRRCGVVTAGAKGCWFCEDGGAVEHIAAFAVPVVDTTGCGDVFHGAYAARLAQGETVKAALIYASAVAALKATAPGGRGGIPRAAQVGEFLNNQHL